MGMNNGMRAKRMKMIAISLSSECIQQPRCSFCYQSKGYITYDWFQLWNAITIMAEAFPQATLAFEYNGYNLGMMLMHFVNHERNQITITTMPSAVSKTFCGAIARYGVSAVALSYDSQKVKSVDEWLRKALLIKEVGMKVSCNFLIQDLRQGIPPEILKYADQLNLLALKPTGKIKDKTMLKVLVEYCKGFLPVALDNCLGYQLGYIKYCGAGKEFCHIRPDGKVVDCCFQGDCYLWLCRNAKRITSLALEDKYHGNALEVGDYIRERR